MACKPFSPAPRHLTWSDERDNNLPEDGVEEGYDNRGHQEPKQLRACLVSFEPDPKAALARESQQGPFRWSE